MPLTIKLHSKQKQAFHSPANEILYGGAVGGGKSYLMRCAAIMWATEIPGLQIFLFRRTFGELKTSHMDGPTGFQFMLHPLVETKHVKITQHEIRFWNGSKIHLCHASLEEDVAQYQSSEFHVLMIDEASSFTEAMYRALRLRVRMTGVTVPKKYEGRFPRILISANPGNIGHQWIKSFFVDDAEDQEIRQMPSAEGGYKRQFIRAIMEDNPTLMRESPNYADSIEGAGSPELVRAMRYGDFNVVAGAYYPEFRRETHVVKPFRIPSYWMRFQAADWGTSDPFAFVWFAVCGDDNFITPDGKHIPKDALVMYREYYGLPVPKGGKQKYNVGCFKTPENVAKSIKKIEKEENLGPISYRVIDPSADKRTTGPSPMELMGAQGVYFFKGDNTRVSGWTVLRQRLQGRNKVPMLYAFETCTHILRTFPMAEHNPKKLEDMRDGEDHLLDAIRYGCMSRPWSNPLPQAKREVEFRNPTMREVEKTLFKKRNRYSERI